MTALPANSTVGFRGAKEVPRVLLVDDESAVAHSVAKLIERLGYQVTVVASGADALLAARRDRFDVVLTDQHMPGMSGAELIAALVNHAGVPCDRVILTSGDLRSEETQDLLARARCRYLEKPFHLHELAQALRAIAPIRRPTRPA